MRPRESCFFYISAPKGSQELRKLTENIVILSSLAFLTLAISSLNGIPAAGQEVNPDSWAATDALGRFNYVYSAEH